jgi:copper chaperone NosL
MKIVVVVLSLLFLIISCQRDSEVKPAEIFYGEEVCDRCKMIISQELFSAQYILLGGKVKKFDDIGCMMNYIFEEEAQKDKVLAIFVRDYNSKEWIEGEKAYYIGSSNIKTPMGHGLVALKEREAAEKLAKEKEGKLLESFSEAKNWVLSQGKK